MLCHSGMLSCNEKVNVDINTGIMKSMMKSSELAELSHSAQCLQTGPCLLGIPLRRLALMRLEYGKSKKGELQMKYLQKVKKNAFIIGTTAAGCYSCTTVSRD